MDPWGFLIVELNLRTHTHIQKREREREKPVYDLEGVSFSLSLMRVISLRRVSGVIDFNFDCKEKRAAGDFFFFFKE